MRSPSRVVAQHIADRQLVLVTGKGGVGKTTTAAALALRAQTQGKRVLLAEVTSDVSVQSPLLAYFGVPWPKGDEPNELMPGLDGVRISPSTGHKLFLRAALRVRMLVDAAMRSAALNRFLLAAPAFPEIGTLYQLVHLVRQEKYDTIILDLPATGHALGLVSLPKTVLKVVPSGLIGNAISEGLEVLTNPERCASILVTLPESLPVMESIELSQGMQEHQVPVGAILLNRMPENPFSDEERAALDSHIAGRQGELLLGTREFRRLERALDARQLFKDNLPEGVGSLEIPVFPERTSKGVIEGVVELLQQLSVEESQS